MFGIFKGLGVTISHLTKKKVTIQYPEEKPKWPERFRGVHEYIPDLCIVCNQCARICPTSCISLTGGRDENKKMRIETYDINFEICIVCGLCAEVCPTEAIRFTTRFELAEYRREDIYKNMEWLYRNHVEHGSFKQLQEEKERAEKAEQAKAAEAASTPKGGDK